MALDIENPSVEEVETEFDEAGSLAAAALWELEDPEGLASTLGDEGLSLKDVLCADVLQVIGMGCDIQGDGDLTKGLNPDVDVQNHFENDGLEATPELDVQTPAVAPTAEVAAPGTAPSPGGIS